MRTFEGAHGWATFLFGPSSHIPFARSTEESWCAKRTVSVMERVGKALFVPGILLIFLLLLGFNLFLQNKIPLGSFIGTPQGNAQSHQFSGRVVFVSNRRGQDGLYEVDPNTLETRVLEEGNGATNYPAVSPRGDLLAFNLTRGGKTAIYLAKLPSGAAYRLTEPGVKVMPAFSPDGTKLVFVNETKSKEIPRSLWEVNASTGQETQLAKPMHWYSEPRFLPDGTLVCTAYLHGKDQIILLDPKTGAETNLTDSKSESTRPAVSPDGKKIAFVSDRHGNPDIYTMSLDGSDVHRLTLGNKVDNRDPGWSPDGRHLVFSSNREGKYNLYVMDLRGNLLKQLTFSEGDNISPVWYRR